MQIISNIISDTIFVSDESPESISRSISDICAGLDVLCEFGYVIGFGVVGGSALLKQRSKLAVSQDGAKFVDRICYVETSDRLDCSPEGVILFAGGSRQVGRGPVVLDCVASSVSIFHNELSGDLASVRTMRICPGAAPLGTAPGEPRGASSQQDIERFGESRLSAAISSIDQRETGLWFKRKAGRRANATKALH